MKPLVVSLPGEMELGGALAERIGGDLAKTHIRSFPDDETYVRLESPIEGRDVVVASTLDRPNTKFLPLVFLAETVRELNAASIGLAAPYLAYMRQDSCFKPGEAMTSRFFGRLLSSSFDWLVTVDPHLHRHSSLDEIYSIPSEVVQAAGPIARWISEHVDRPLLIGPDEESQQWIAAVASAGSFPSVILEKSRHGDYDVEVSGKSAPMWSNQQPVVVDDIISTGRTMVGAVEYLARRDLPPPICIGIHGLFVEDAFQALTDAGAAKIITCNTVPHPSNSIDINEELAAGVRAMLEEVAG